MDVQPDPREILEGLALGDRRRRVGRPEAELGAGAARLDGRVPAGADARRDAHRDRLYAPGAAGRCGHARRLAEGVDDDEPCAGSHGGVDLVLALGVAVQDEAVGRHAGPQRSCELGGRRDVASQPFLGQHPQHPGRRAGLEREGREAARRRARRAPA